VEGLNDHPGQATHDFLAEPVEAQEEMTDIFWQRVDRGDRKSITRLQPIITAISIVKAALLPATGASVARFGSTFFLHAK
jgi:hypothetical protein